MSFLNRLFGEPNLTYRGVPKRSNECCTQQDLMPRWRNPEVMSDDAEAMGFVCHQCGREYLPVDVEGRRLAGGPR